jgi:ketosteroid isomerase-like protein
LRGFDAFAAGDPEVVKNLFAPDAHYHHARLGILNGDYKGRQAIEEFFGQIGNETNGTFRAEPVVIAASGDRVFVLYRATGTRAGKTIDGNDVLVLTLRDGLVTEALICPGDYPTLAAFWL